MKTSAETTAQKESESSAASRMPRFTRLGLPAPVFCATKVANPLAKSCAGE